MYAKHFGLKQAPFSIAPDPRYLYMSERHREALAHLLYGLAGSGGIVVLTGEIGAGKTTVCRCFLEQVPKDCNVAYIFNPKLTVVELLRTVCDEFHIAGGNLERRDATVKDYVDAINAFLLREHAQGRNNVLIIDEAQNLAPEVLEQLRLLTNLETAERKLLQIILIGQPELRAMLAQPAMEQLAQRVIARYHLEALNEEETQAYIRHRLVVAGRHGFNPFDGDARKRIHSLSRGVPRRINLLCDRALLGAYARGTQRVTGTIVDHAAVEVFGTETPKRFAWRAGFGERAPWVAGGLLGGALLVALTMWTVRATQNAAPAPTATSTSTPAVAPKPSATAAMAATPAPSVAPTAAATPTITTGPAPTTSPATAAPTSTLAAASAFASLSQLRPLRDEQQAWRMLALATQVTLGEGDPCLAVARQKLGCQRRNDGSLSQLRALKQPAVLTLRDERGDAGYTVYTGVSDDHSVMLRGEGGERVKLDLLTLATVWRGELGTFKPAPAVAP